MNDPDRPRSPDGCDDDAIFADIVAHLNDEVSTAGPTTQASTDQVAEDVEPTGQTPPPAEESAGPTDVEARPTQDAAGSADDTAGSAQDTADEQTGRPPGAWPRGEPLQWPMNPWPRNPWPAGQPASQPPAPRGHGDPPAPSAPHAWRSHELPDEDEEHFEPPPVTPLPAGDLAFWGILAGMGGGPLLLLYLIFFNRDAGYWILTAIAMFIGGFVLLVSRMPGHHGDDDDGARL